MSASGVFKLISGDGKQDRLLMATYLRVRHVDDIENRRVAREQLHARFVSMLYERRSMLPTYHYWALRRGHGDFGRLPLDVRKIIIRYAHRWYDRAVPLEEIVSRCQNAGDEPLVSHVRGWMDGRVQDLLYRAGRDYREWAL